MAHARPQLTSNPWIPACNGQGLGADSAGMINTLGLGDAWPACSRPPAPTWTCPWVTDCTEVEPCSALACPRAGTEASEPVPLRHICPWAPASQQLTPLMARGLGQRGGAGHSGRLLPAALCTKAARSRETCHRGSRHSKSLLQRFSEQRHVAYRANPPLLIYLFL